jgi:hypothetical protein
MSYPKYSKDCGFTSSIQKDKGSGLTDDGNGNFSENKEAKEKGWTLVSQYTNKGYKQKWTPICKRFGAPFYDKLDNFNEKEIDYKGTGRKRKQKSHKRKSHKRKSHKKSCRK